MTMASLAWAENEGEGARASAPRQADWKNNVLQREQRVIWVLPRRSLGAEDNAWSPDYNLA